MTKETPFASSGIRVLISVVIGLIAGILVGIFVSWKYAPLVTWDIAAVTFLIWLWFALGKRNAEETAVLAVREDPGRAGADAVLLLASVASLVAVGVILAQANHTNGAQEFIEVSLGIASVVISWIVVHAVYALKYAQVYYKNNGGIDFNNNLPPAYSDFVYLALTIGMTFQVSDTTLKSNEFRRLALKHALLSYLFGTVIVATTINLIAGLGK